jgi:hypothetical protein
VALVYETRCGLCDIIEANHVTSGTATYLYCIVHAARSPAVLRLPAGLSGATLPSLVPLARSMWLVVAAVPLGTYGSVPLESALRDIDWVAEVAVAHEAVVDHFARQPRTTVVPMKLFTMFSSLDRAIEVMHPRLRETQAIVRRIAGCEEWGVRLTRTPAPAASRTRSAVVDRPSSGIAFLAAKKEARDTAREAAAALAAAADRAFSTLAAIAKDARRRDDAPAGVAPPLLDAAFLVPAARRARFKAAVRRLDASSRNAGADLTLTGPWPAYNFVHGGSAA